MVAACVLSAALEEPLMPWWSEWPRSIPVPASVDPLDGFLSPNDSTDVTAPPTDTHSTHDVRSVETPLESIDPATPPAAPQAPPQTPATSRRSTDERPAAPGSSGDECGEPRAPPRPANFLPPFFDSELRVVRRPRRAIDLTGPHPRQPPPSSGATPPPDRRKRRYASGKLSPAPPPADQQREDQGLRHTLPSSPADNASLAHERSPSSPRSTLDLPLVAGCPSDFQTFTRVGRQTARFTPLRPTIRSLLLHKRGVPHLSVLGCRLCPHCLRGRRRRFKSSTRFKQHIHLTILKPHLHL